MADDNAFGIIGGRSEPYEGETTPEDELSAMFADDSPDDRLEVSPEGELPPAEDEADGAATTAVAPADGEPEEGADEPPAPQGDEDLVTEGTTPEEVDREAELLAGRFQEVDQLVDAYKNIQGAFTRVAQDRQRDQAILEQQAAMLQEQQDQLDQLVTVLQSSLAKDDPELAEKLERAQEIQAAVDARLGPIQERLQEYESYEEDPEAQALEAARQQAQVTLGSFYQSKGIQPGSDDDKAMGRTAAQLARAGVPLDIRRPEHLEVVLEAARNPDLALELAMAPNAINIPNGVERLKARVGGGTIPPATGAPAGTPPAGQQQNGPTRKRVEAFVEVGSGGAPVEAAPGEDEFDIAAKWYQQEYGSKGPLFGSTR